MKIVKFADGKYGIRVHWFLGWEFFDINRYQRGFVSIKPIDLISASDKKQIYRAKADKATVIKAYEDLLEFKTQAAVNPNKYSVLKTHIVLVNGKIRVGAIDEN